MNAPVDKPHNREFVIDCAHPEAETLFAAERARSFELAQIDLAQEPAAYLLVSLQGTRAQIRSLGTKKEVAILLMHLNTKLAECFLNDVDGMRG